MISRYLSTGPLPASTNERRQRGKQPPIFFPSFSDVFKLFLAFPWPLESLARIMCPRNEDQKPPSSNRHSPPPVLLQASSCPPGLVWVVQGGEAAPQSHLPAEQSSHCTYRHRAAGTSYSPDVAATVHCGLGFLRVWMD